MIYHVSHERNVFPELGIPSDEKLVAHALPKIGVALRHRADSPGYARAREISSLLPLAGTDGRPASRQEAPRLARGRRSGDLAPAEI